MNKISFAALVVVAMSAQAERTESLLTDGWQFSRGTLEAPEKWENVRVPHDWAIYGPFDRANDLLVVAVELNG